MISGEKDLNIKKHLEKLIKQAKPRCVNCIEIVSIEGIWGIHCGCPKISGPINLNGLIDKWYFPKLNKNKKETK
jgi:hypothetical protein